MKKFLLLFPLTFIITFIFAQGPWTQRSSITGGNPRHRAIAFNIGGRGYVGCGWNGVTMWQDFWEYDPGSNSWTQKADYPNGPRLSAFGFSIGSYGYAGMGLDPNLDAQADCNKYDPLTNTWTPIASFPATPLFGTSPAVVNGKAYIAFGDEWFPNYTRHAEVWKYDPMNDSWNYASTCPGPPRRDAVGFAIGNKIYFGTGNDDTYNEQNDWWEYDPSTGFWTAKAFFAGSPRSQAVGFAAAGKGYVGTGGLADVQDFWEYDPVNDSWQGINSFPGAGRENSSAFTIGSLGYVTTGTSGTNYNDLWEFNPLYVTGLNNLSKNVLVSIYPNPMHEEATLRIMNGSELRTPGVSVIFYDPTGNKILPEIIRNLPAGQTGSDSYLIRRGSLPAGTYFYQVLSSEKPVASGKLIIQ